MQSRVSNELVASCLSCLKCKEMALGWESIVMHLRIANEHVALAWLSQLQRVSSGMGGVHPCNCGFPMSLWPMAWLFKLLLRVVPGIGCKFCSCGRQLV